MNVASIPVERINYFRDLIDAICVVTGQQLTTAQTWEFAREYALIEAQQSNGSSTVRASEGPTDD